MPEVILTREQAARKMQAQIQRRISDGLAVARARDYKSIARMAAALKIDERVLSKLLDGDFGSRMRFDQMLTVWALAKVYNDVSERDKRGEEQLL